MSARLRKSYELAQRVLNDYLLEMRVDDVIRLTGLKAAEADEVLEMLASAHYELRWSR